MKHNIYAVFDRKTSFAAPFVDSSDDSAKRGFYFAFSQQSNIISFAPDDFSLYRIGTFDSESGFVESVVPPVFVCNAYEFKKGVFADASSSEPSA